MKIFINLTEYILILLVFYGCNGDVFVDDFRSADSELTLDGNGDTKIIRFASSNWDVWECIRMMKVLPIRMQCMMRVVI